MRAAATAAIAIVLAGGAVAGYLAAPALVERLAGAPPRPAATAQQLGAFVPSPPGTPAPDLVFLLPDGGEARLSDFRGRVVLLNLWATWCAPCVREMPSLDRLQALSGGPDFEVVALSLDRGGLEQVAPFYERLGIGNLAVYLDPRNESMRALRPRGLPTTIVVGRDGTELGRVEGEKEWDGPAAQELVRNALAGRPLS